MMQHHWPTALSARIELGTIHNEGMGYVGEWGGGTSLSEQCKLLSQPVMRTYPCAYAGNETASGRPESGELGGVL
jgi:hypothetical protein